ncbi:MULTISPECIES: DUF3568 family protein [unclassified Francisella]|uniref:DUF3568 family protein n=1 Tax=unclassified Francisella TaxID=2610885 RepID=UPI002E36AF22|nr:MULTISPECIES: DUF3568 family protein [unclassified Francisella]MED7818523.1 DUF3568 family protein [Francisella sp. 19S2-4]MED7829359.1 DUF3568 family protein [Francisella sp. 19S2-10]
MKILKTNFKFFSLAIFLTLISACTTFDGNDIKYKNGYSIANVNKSLDNVYNEVLRLIESGQAPSLSGSAYTMNTNQKNENKAFVLAVNDNNPNDFIEAVMQKTSANTTRLSVKYGKQGDSIKSATLISLIQEN